MDNKNQFIKNIEIRAKSESMTRWIKRLEEEFNVEADGDTPTVRMESVISKIKQELGIDIEQASALNCLIASAFNVGAQEGFKRALQRVEDGKITVRKIMNEERWQLSSSSRQYQITEELPSFDGSELKETVYIELSEHGFE